VSGTLTGCLPRAVRRPLLLPNTAEATPQAGLSSADLVAEGGLTRLAAFYWTELPPVVGPVRSIRATDIGIVLPAGASLVASGGAPKTFRQVSHEKIPT